MTAVWVQKLLTALERHP